MGDQGERWAAMGLRGGARGWAGGGTSDPPASRKELLGWDPGA